MEFEIYLYLTFLLTSLYAPTTAPTRTGKDRRRRRRRRWVLHVNEGLGGICPAIFRLSLCPDNCLPKSAIRRSTPSMQQVGPGVS